MKTIKNIEIKYKKETGENSIYRKTKNDLLIYDEKYVHWLKKRMVANGAKSKRSELLIQNVSDLLFAYEMRTNNNRLPTMSDILAKTQIKQFLANYKC